MKRFQKILAVLPENHAPEALLAWTGLLGRASSATAIHFLDCQAAPLPVYPPGSESEGGESSEPLNPNEELLASSFETLPYHAETLRESPLKPILQHLSSGEFDLVVIAAQDSTGRALAERLARKSPVGVLVLPSQSIAPPQRILAAFDLSEISKLVLEWSEAFATLGDPQAAQLEAVHVTRAPTTARSTMAISPEALRKLILENGSDLMTSFLNENAAQTSHWQQQLLVGYDFGQTLTECGSGEKGDLLVIASQGRSALSVAVLGSQAATIIRGAQCPVLVVKQKNASLGFLRQLLGQTS